MSSGYPDDEDAYIGNGIPRVVQIKIDEENKKIIEYSSFTMGIPTGEFMGSATLLNEDTNTYIIGWGGSVEKPNNAIFTEVDFKNKKILCEMVPTGRNKTQTYRVYKFTK